MSLGTASAGQPCHSSTSGGKDTSGRAALLPGRSVATNVQIEKPAELGIGDLNLLFVFFWGGGARSRVLPAISVRMDWRCTLLSNHADACVPILMMSTMLLEERADLLRQGECVYLRHCDASSECETARQHKVAGVACYQLERTLVGCADPPSKRVGAPHQCSRVNQKRSGWVTLQGSLSRTVQ